MYKTDVKSRLLDALEEDDVKGFGEAVQLGIAARTNWEHQYKDRDCKTILHLVVEKSDVYLKELLKSADPNNRVDVNAVDQDGLSTFQLLLLRLVHLANVDTSLDVDSANEDLIETQMNQAMGCMIMLLNDSEFDLKSLSTPPKIRLKRSHKKLAKMTCLQVVCSFQPWTANAVTDELHRKLEEIVHILLGKGVDPNATIREQPPLWLATIRGYHRVVNVFKANPRTKFLIRDKENSNLLQAAIIGYYYKVEIHGDGCTENNNDTLSCLLSDDNPRVQQEMISIINNKDLFGNTALHFASLFGAPRMMLLLMSKGAKLAKNDSGVFNIDADTLKELLDDCVDGEGDDIDDEDFVIKINFHFFLNSKKTTFKNTIDRESGVAAKKPSPASINMDHLDLISEDESLRDLLKHPVIISLLEMQNNWFSKMMIASDVLAYFLLVAVMCIFYNWHFNSQPLDIYGGTYYTCVVIIASLCLAFITCKLLFDLWHIGWRRTYLFAIFRATIIILAIVNLIPGSGISHVAHRHLSALGMLLTGIQWYMLYVGLFPDQPAAIHCQMYMKVLRMYAHILLSYWIFIFMFAFSFYTIFHHYPDDNNSIGPYGSNDTKDGHDPYKNFGTSLVKTFLAFTGDIGYGEQAYEHWIAYVILVLFVFLVMIVLMNVLNGLAVSDVSEFRKSISKELETKREAQLIARMPEARVSYDQIVIYPNILPEKKSWRTFWESEPVYRIKIGRRGDEIEDMKDDLISKTVLRAAFDKVHQRIQNKYSERAALQKASGSTKPAGEEESSDGGGLEARLKELEANLELRLNGIQAKVDSIGAKQESLDYGDP